MLMSRGGHGRRGLGPGEEPQGPGRPDPHGIRLLALLAVAAAVAALPLTVAFAGQVREAGRVAVRPPAHDDAKRSVSARSPLLRGPGLATAVRCGSPLSSGDGIEAQTCVLTRAGDVWARTYYRNASGERLSSVLNLMAPDGRTVETRCTVAAADDPETCETPPQHVTGDPGAYAAVAEFARGDGGGPLLLRSGSERPESSGQ
ncbi:hypothetical protein [Streptomyces glomeratus]|uniref:Uncharacterized protein n=1 Tax=Streptomyces glomeratus TaxID=284452 RepID=A0ABP6LGB9_9ACTN|nr:hypothetical protein [Streptomyces glomeratus]MCF1509403.1 hypothetical protein [Streptomyces glomeratus]